MGYIVLTRNPRSKMLVVLMTEGDCVFEFRNYDEADEFANASAMFHAWGYEILEVENI